MKVFAVLSALLAACVAKPSLAPLVYSTAVIPVITSSQYHVQDTLGQYNYGYSNANSAATESRSLDGTTHGGYSYIDANGKLQTTVYTADATHGFRVAATNLPVAPKVPKIAPLEAPKPVKDTIEVAKAKAEHFAAIEEAKFHKIVHFEGLKPVKDTIEVAKAKAEHFAAIEEAKRRSQIVDSFITPVSPVAYHPHVYSFPVNAPSVSGYSYSAHDIRPTWSHYGLSAPLFIH